MERPIYLDYNATTPIDPAVVEAMLPYLYERHGNASSAHAYGYEAREAVERARQQVARLIGARPGEIVFAGGGSETDNQAIKGMVFARLREHPHVISTAVEHPAVLNTLAYLKHRFDVDYTLLPVDDYGLLDPDELRGALRAQTVLVTVMHGNNEVGTLQSLREIGAITREAGVLLHVDAAQSAGKVPINVDDLHIDLLSVVGHKLYGPKGIAVLYVRTGIKLDPLVHGSSQEHGMRAGTENVASIVGLGEACRLALEELERGEEGIRELRDTLYRLLCDEIPELQLNGHPTERLPNTLNVSLPDVQGGVVLACTPGVAASTGSACHSGETAPSSVLTAMGFTPERALGAVRLSLGRWTTEEEISGAAALLGEGYRQVSSLYAAY